MNSIVAYKVVQLCKEGEEEEREQVTKPKYSEMSHQVKKNRKGRRGRGRKRPSLMDMPDNVLLHVLSFLDEPSLEAVSAVSQRSRDLVCQKAEKKACQGLQLVQLPTEVLTLIASKLDIKDLGRLAQVNKRFKVYVH